MKFHVNITPPTDQKMQLAQYDPCEIVINFAKEFLVKSPNKDIGNTLANVDDYTSNKEYDKESKKYMSSPHIVYRASRTFKAIVKHYTALNHYANEKRVILNTYLCPAKKNSQRSRQHNFNGMETYIAVGGS